MRMLDLILKKRSREELSTDEISYIVKGYTAGTIPDYQMSALFMAIYFNGCSDRETSDLTLAMAHSGDMLDLSMIHGIKVDKHSTGGVGDKVSLIVAPIAASCGVPVAKMSGRGLGFTGGTIDKLESIPGFSTELTEKEFIDNVNRTGIAIMGQTADLAPADRLMYALRDVTGTVENMSLIASSIMSKKIAAGADAIVLDVTCGSGAFMKNENDAEALAKKMVSIGKAAGLNTTAVITDMNEPLGRNIGNSLEVIEAVKFLKGHGEPDLNEVCRTIAGQMLLAGGMAADDKDAADKVDESIRSGKALDKLLTLVENQHGDTSVILDTDRFTCAPVLTDVIADRSGYISSVKCSQIGECVKILGGGREEKGQKIDLSVGIEMLKKTGAEVNKGEKIAVIHASDEARAAEAAAHFLDAFVFSDKAPDIGKLIHGIIKA